VLLLFVSGKASGVPARAGLERPSDRRGKAVAAPAAYVDYSAPSNSLEDPPARERISESAGDPLAIPEGRRMSGGLAFRFLPFPRDLPHGIDQLLNIFGQPGYRLLFDAETPMLGAELGEYSRIRARIFRLLPCGIGLGLQSFREAHSGK
jgi:hypothetical protein